MQSCFTKDGITIYHSFIENFTLPEQVDLVVTDPPYKLTSGGNNTSTLGGCLAKENYNNSGAIVDCDIEWSTIMKVCYNSLKDDTQAYIMCNNRNVQPMLNEAENAGFYFHNLLVWDKVAPVANKWYMKNLEFTGFFKKGKAKTINNAGSSALFRHYQRDETDHPTEKPVDLMVHYIENSTNEGDLVFDPFMGSGTTAIACLKTNRRFIGVEKEIKYFNVAKERIIHYNSNKLM